MDITITISDIAVENIQEKAKGRSVDDFVEEFIEENFANGSAADNLSGIEKKPSRKRNLSDLAGMFSGGPGDTAERAPEILRAEMGISSLGRD